MRLLLDTHAFLWFATNDNRLSGAANSAISDPANEVYVSPASFWELAIKVSIGKLNIIGPYFTFIETAITRSRFDVLAIEASHVSAIIGLPHHHRDPFDRLLIAQAMVEKLTMVTNDAKIGVYPVSCYW